VVVSIGDNMLENSTGETLTAEFSRWNRETLSYNTDFSRSISRM